MKLLLRRTPATDATIIAKIGDWLIKTRLVSLYCHGGIAIDNTLYHATVQNGLNSIEYDPSKWDVIDLGNDRDAEVIALYEKHKSSKYDWFSLLSFLLPFKFSDSKRMYCYEWCWLAVTGNIPDGTITPELLLLYINGIKK